MNILKFPWLVSMATTLPTSDNWEGDDSWPEKVIVMTKDVFTAYLIDRNFQICEYIEMKY